MSEYLKSCEKAARAAGEVLADWQGKFRVREKGRADLVTEADEAAQAAIQEILFDDFPGFNFLGEEGGTPHKDCDPESPYRWIVDPLDGTTNYVHGLPNYSVSIALEESGKLLAGVVYDPVHDLCFKSALGQGAWCNADRLSVTTARSLDEALIAASFPPNVTADSPEIRHFVNVLTKCQAIRRLGSAALNLAYVAAGYLDGYWAGAVKAWDVAAGVLLVQEAGGIVRGYHNQSLDLDHPKLVATCTAELQTALQAEID